MKKTALFIVAVLACVTGLAAQVPPFPAWGADAVPDLYAPNLAGPGAFSTTTGGAPASAINPAQGGEAQRIVFDVGYLGLAGLGAESGYGNAGSRERIRQRHRAGGNVPHPLRGFRQRFAVHSEPF